MHPEYDQEGGYPSAENADAEAQPGNALASDLEAILDHATIGFVS
jgi:hypothetical protein